MRSYTVQHPGEKEWVMSWSPIFHAVFPVIQVVVMKWNYFNRVHHFFFPLYWYFINASRFERDIFLYSSKNRAVKTQPQFSERTVKHIDWSWNSKTLAYISTCFKTQLLTVLRLQSELKWICTGIMTSKFRVLQGTVIHTEIWQQF